MKAIPIPDGQKKRGKYPFRRPQGLPVRPSLRQNYRPLNLQSQAHLQGTPRFLSSAIEPIAGNPQKMDGYQSLFRENPATALDETDAPSLLHEVEEVVA